MIALVFLSSFIYSVKSCGEVHVPSRTQFIRSVESADRKSTVRIIGGNRAAPGAWPWQAYIKYRDATDGEMYLCGGSLISSRHVLTAAHCAITMDVKRTSVEFGVINTTEYSDQILKIAVKSKLIHPKYSSNDFVNPSQLFDIAILTLSSNVPFSDLIHPVCLPSPSKDISDYAYVTGYGAFNDGRIIYPEASKYLQQTAVPVLDQQMCSDRREVDLLDYDGGFPVEDSQLCAGTTGHGSAQGDSGGPLVQQAEDGVWYQIGVVSFGVNFGRGYYDQAFAPGIYTRVSSFCDFINSSTTGEAQCSTSSSSSSHNYFVTCFSFILLLIQLL